MDHFIVVSWNLELTFLCFIAKTISFLNDNRWQSDEKMLCKNGNAQSSTTFFRHSAVLSLPAILLRKFSIVRMIIM